MPRPYNLKTFILTTKRRFGPMAGRGHTSKKIVILALGMNVTIALVKGLVAYSTQSTAMAAEAVHSAADSGNQVLLLLGMYLGMQGASEKHPFGRGKESYFWSFIVAICLFMVGACYSIYEGVHTLFAEPYELTNAGWAYAVLIIASILESVALRAAYLEVKEKKGDMSYWRYMKESKNTEIMIVFLEDIGAQCGLLIALIGLTLYSISGHSHWDGIASIGIGVLLAVIAYFLAVEIKSLLIGEAATDKDMKKVYNTVSSFPSVRKIIHVDSLQMGPDRVLVALKIDFNDDLTISEIEKEINEIESDIRKKVPDAYKIYIEPDAYIENYDQIHEQQEKEQDEAGPAGDTKAPTDA